MKKEIASIKDTLNILLGSEYVLQVKIQGFHWNLQDPNFMSVHVEWGSHYELISAFVDQIAERIRSIRGIPASNMKELRELSIISEATSTLASQQAQLDQLIPDHSDIINLCKGILDGLGNIQDQPSIDLVTRVQACHEKILWQLESSNKF